MKKSPNDYQFGTFDERLEHFCALFEIEPPEIVFEDGEPTATQPLMDWVAETHVCMDWLFMGRPDDMLKEWSKTSKDKREIVDVVTSLDPEVKRGLVAMAVAIVEHGLPMEESMQVFHEVVQEWRAKKEVV